MNQNDPSSKRSKLFYSYFIKLLMIFHFGSFWVILGNFSIFWVIFGSFWVILVGLFWVILFWIILACSGSFWLITHFSTTDLKA